MAKSKAKLHVASKYNVDQLSEQLLFAANPEAVLPLLSMIGQAQLSIDDLLGQLSRQFIEQMLILSAQTVAGAKHPPRVRIVVASIEPRTRGGDEGQELARYGQAFKDRAIARLLPSWHTQNVSSATALNLPSCPPPPSSTHRKGARSQQKTTRLHTKLRHSGVSKSLTNSGRGRCRLLPQSRP